MPLTDENDPGLVVDEKTANQAYQMGSATDLDALQRMQSAEALRAQQMYMARVGGSESLAREKQRMGMANLQRQMAMQSAAGGSPLAGRQAMMGSTGQATGLAGEAGAGRQQEIMGARATLADVYGGQSQRLLAMQEMENRRRAAEMQIRIEREKARLIKEQADMDMISGAVGAGTQAAGAMAGMGATYGGGGQSSGSVGGASGNAGAGAYGSGGYGGTYGGGKADYDLGSYGYGGYGSDFDVSKYGY
jgi:hypothetical protein